MKLEQFSKWLIARGRSPLTAKNYVKDVRLSIAHSDGPLGRLLDKTLAPKTRRRTLAALRSYGKFTNDDKLLRRLTDIKLPAPNRIIQKIPLDKDDWQHLIQAISKAKIDVPIKCVLQIIAVRGFRSRDLLNVSRAEILASLDSGVLVFTAKGGQELSYSIEMFRKQLETLVKLKWNQLIDTIDTDQNIDRAQIKLNKTLRQIGETIGIPSKELYLHRLRRTVATHYLKAAGGDLTKLTKFFQWQSITTAASYVDHEERKELDEIAAKLFDPIAEQ